MEDEKTVDTTTEDPIKNVKAEFDRKLGNYETKLTSLETLNREILERIKQPVVPPPVVAEDDMSTLMYSDPSAYAARIKEQAKQEMRQEIGAANAANTRTQQVLTELTSDYPELGDPNNAFTKRAVAIYTSYSDEEKKTPISLKTAVKEAALEMNMKVKSKREEQDDYTVTSSGSSTSAARKRKGGQSELPEGTEAFARMMGLDMDDAEVRARVASRNDRKWSKYTAVPTPAKKVKGE